MLISSFALFFNQNTNQMIQNKLFIWKEEYALNIPKIDEQHKQLVTLINNLYKAFMNKTHIEAVGDVLLELKNYTEYHFRFEETLFSNINFPEKKEHLKTHEAFEAKIQSFHDEYLNNPKSVTFRLISYLQSWLVDHIMVADRKYVI